MEHQGGGHIADNLADRHTSPEFRPLDFSLQEIPYAFNGRNVSCKNKEADKSQQKHKVNPGKTFPVKDKGINKNNNRRGIGWYYMDNGAQREDE